MRFFTTLIVSALAAIAAAQTKANAFNVPKEGNYLLKAGQPTTLTWSNKEGSTVTLTLRSGANSNLDKGEVIVANLPNTGSYTYTPPKDITEGATYAIEIKNDDNPSQVNYTPQFPILSDVKAVPTIKSGSVTATRSSASTATDSSATETETDSSATETATDSTATSTRASRSQTSSTATASPASVPSDNAGRVVKVGSGLLAVAVGFAAAL